MVFWIVSGIAGFIFFMLGWVGAQREFSFPKLFIGCLVTCLPLTVIWWLFELIDWPTSLERMVYPLVVLWAPYLVGALVHQIIEMLRRRGG